MFVLRSLLLLAVVSLSAAAPDLFPARDDITHAAPLDAFRSQWYSTQLAAMREPVLPDAPDTVYRFLWLRTFQPGIAVRIGCARDSCQMVATMLSGAGGYAPATVVKHVVRTLSAPEVTEFHRQLESIDFWRPQPEGGTAVGFNPDGTMYMGLDGAEWVLEGRRLGTYHLWDIFTPQVDGPFGQFRTLCLAMVGFADFDIPAAEVY
jgi:hypothetical protein